MKPHKNRGFSLTELLVAVAVISLLAAVSLPLLARTRGNSRLAQCVDNLKNVNQAVLKFADANNQRLPDMAGAPVPGGWWHYKEKVKSYAGLTGHASPADKVFACPDDRGYGEESEKPFCQNGKYNYTSYVFNGVNLPGIPNIGSRDVTAIRQPERTLLTMEWTAHGPLSWHRSLTGRANTPFYNNAESVVGFVDGHVALTKIYYDGLNAAYTRDPAPGYAYKYSGD